MKSQEQIEAEKNKWQQDVIITKYRLFGREGVTEHEFNMLIEWQIVKKIKTFKIKPKTKKVKRIVMKRRRNNETKKMETR